MDRSLPDYTPPTPSVKTYEWNIISAEVTLGSFDDVVNILKLNAVGVAQDYRYFITTFTAFFCIGLFVTLRILAKSRRYSLL